MVGIRGSISGTDIVVVVVKCVGGKLLEIGIGVFNNIITFTLYIAHISRHRVHCS
jgi:hypothetical protein